jgi:hypothetical protein
MMILLSERREKVLRKKWDDDCDEAVGTVGADGEWDSRVASP